MGGAEKASNSCRKNWQTLVLRWLTKISAHNGIRKMLILQGFRHWSLLWSGRQKELLKNKDCCHSSFQFSHYFLYRLWSTTEVRLFSLFSLQTHFFSYFSLCNCCITIIRTDEKSLLKQKIRNCVKNPAIFESSKLDKVFFKDHGILAEWVKTRNTFIHGLYKNAGEYKSRKREFEELAKKGEQYARALYNEVRRLRRLLKSHPELFVNLTCPKKSVCFEKEKWFFKIAHLHFR